MADIERGLVGEVFVRALGGIVAFQVVPLVQH